MHPLSKDVCFVAKNVISACEKVQQWQQALGLLAVMQQTCVLLGVISYSAVISACEKG